MSLAVRPALAGLRQLGTKTGTKAKLWKPLRSMHPSPHHPCPPLLRSSPLLMSSRYSGTFTIPTHLSHFLPQMLRASHTSTPDTPPTSHSSLPCLFTPRAPHASPPPSASHRPHTDTLSTSYFVLTLPSHPKPHLSSTSALYHSLRTRLSHAGHPLPSFLPPHTSPLPGSPLHPSHSFPTTSHPLSTLHIPASHHFLEPSAAPDTPSPPTSLLMSLCWPHPLPVPNPLLTYIQPSINGHYGQISPGQELGSRVRPLSQPLLAG